MQSALGAGVMPKIGAIDDLNINLGALKAQIDARKDEYESNFALYFQKLTELEHQNNEKTNELIKYNNETERLHFEIENMTTRNQ